MCELAPEGAKRLEVTQLKRGLVSLYLVLLGIIDDPGHRASNRFVHPLRDGAVDAVVKDLPAAGLASLRGPLLHHPHVLGLDSIG